MSKTKQPFIPKQYRLLARISITLEENGCKHLTDMMYEFARKVQAASGKRKKSHDDGWVPVAALNRMYAYMPGQKTSDSTRARNIKILREANLIEHERGRIRWCETGTESAEMLKLAREFQEDDDPVLQRERWIASQEAYKAAHAPRGRGPKGQFLPRQQG